jgi:alpha-glucosidase (family GH31 glycosyl hydrolase)
MYAIHHRFVVLNADGSPHRIDTHAPWFSNSLVLDFTNQGAADWWLKKRKYLLAEMGVDGFKTDGGEHIWNIETRFENGMRGSRGINYYPIAYEEAYCRFLEAHRGEDHVLFSRAGYTGVQQVSLHWTGDEKSTWDAFRATLFAMLNVGLCGISFIGWDMAGFSGELPSSELYSRAVAASVFCPIMQFHSEHSDQKDPCQDRTPWNIQKVTRESNLISRFRQFANLRMNLLPYILSQAWLASQSGIPLMRALPIQFPNDTVCRYYPLEYCFGEALLIAPIVEPGKVAWQVYLPQGDWRDIWTGEVYKGPQVIETPAPLSNIPAFQRKGTILPLNLSKDMTLCSPVGNAVDQFQNLCLFIYPDRNCEVPLYNRTWNEIRWVRCSRLDEIGELEIYLPAMEDALHIFLFEVRAMVVLCDSKPLPKSVSVQKNTSAPGWTFVPDKLLTHIDLLASPRPLKVTIRYR